MLILKWKEVDTMIRYIEVNSKSTRGGGIVFNIFFMNKLREQHLKSGKKLPCFLGAFLNFKKGIGK